MKKINIEKMSTTVGGLTENQACTIFGGIFAIGIIVGCFGQGWGIAMSASAFSTGYSNGCI